MRPKNADDSPLKSRKLPSHGPQFAEQRTVFQKTWFFVIEATLNSSSLTNSIVCLRKNVSTCDLCLFMSKSRTIVDPKREVLLD